MPKYCLNCSSLLITKRVDGRSRPVCPSCDRVHYLNPVPSVAAVLIQDGRVLLVKRNIEPGYGLWGLPGGFIEIDESPTEAVAREVYEETGLTCKVRELIACTGSIESVYGSIIVICYTAEIVSGVPKAGDDAQAVNFFNLDNLPSIAFKDHLHFIEKVTGYELAYHEV